LGKIIIIITMVFLPLLAQKLLPSLIIIPITTAILRQCWGPRYSVVLNVRKCSAPHMAWRFIPGGLTMENDPLLVISVTKHLDMRFL
jgi:hypothetical protein